MKCYRDIAASALRAPFFKPIAGTARAVAATAVSLTAVSLTAVSLLATAAPGAAASPQDLALLAPGHPDAVIEAPPPLTVADQERYRRIFALQQDGHWAKADALIGELDDRMLIGHVLFQRYMHPTKYRSKYKELKRWMDAHADHPGSSRIYRLALKRQPGNWKPPRRPDGPRQALGFADVPAESVYRSPRKRSRATWRAVRRLESRVRHLVGEDRMRIALATIDRRDNRRLLDDVEYDRARARIAAGYFYYGLDETALKLAAASAAGSRAHLDSPDWVAGIAAWRLERHEVARQHFEALARSRVANAERRAAGAYWAARANLVVRRPQAVNRHLAIAAAHPRTFYGLLAARALGQAPDLHWSPPPLSEDEAARVMAIPAARRAAALAVIGQAELAEAELRRVYLGANPALGPALLALANRLGLASMQLRLARGVSRLDGTPYDTALYPVPQWTPDGGFKIDRALIYALMRQESAFRPKARSHAGARGLMQLMPRTASFIARDRKLARGDRKKLFDPGLNLKLAQRYLDHLLANPTVGGSVVRLAIAYNAGPGNLARWLKRKTASDDTLLLIESLPSRETRNFVRNVLTNLWIYRDRLRQQAPTLDAMAAGEWPTFRSMEGHPIRIAQRGRGE